MVGAGGRARGGLSRPRGAAALEARGAGSAARVQRDPSAPDPAAVDEGGVPGKEPLWDLRREGEGPRGDPEEGSEVQLGRLLRIISEMPAAAARGS